MDSYFDRVVLGRKNRGCRVDPQSRQSVQFMPHSGDISYPLVAGSAIANKSEYQDLSRERTLNIDVDPNLNEVGENKNIVKRTQKARYIQLD